MQSPATQPCPSPGLRLDVVKGALICLMVLGHALQFCVGPLVDTTPTGFSDGFLFKAIYLFHMPAFFFVSGLLRGLRPPQISGGGAFLLRRCLRLAVPMLAWFVLLCLLVQLAFDKVVPWTNPRMFQMMALSFWFVFLVLCFDGLAQVLAWLRMDRPWVWLLFWVVLLCSAQELRAYHFEYGLLFWCAGYWLMRRLGSLSRLPQPPAWSAWLALASLLVLAVFWQGGWFVYWRPWHVLIHGAGDVALRVAAQLLATACALVVLWRVSGSARLAWLVPVGRRSLGVYFAQTLVFMACMFGANRLAAEGVSLTGGEPAGAALGLLLTALLLAFCLALLRVLSLLPGLSLLLLGEGGLARRPDARAP